MHFAQAQYPQAVKMWRMALDQIPAAGARDVRMRLQRNIGCALVKMGSYQEATAAFEAVMETAPDFQAGFNLVVCYFALGNAEMLRQGFQRLLQVPLPVGEGDEDDVGDGSHAGSHGGGHGGHGGHGADGKADDGGKGAGSGLGGASGGGSGGGGDDAAPASPSHHDGPGGLGGPHDVLREELGARQRAALAFVTLKDWQERPDTANASQAVAGRAFGALARIRDAFIFPLSPPPIPELGTASGFSFRLQDRAGLGHDALLAARNQMLGMAGKSPLISQIRPEGLEDAPQLQLDIDRDKAQALGVGFDAINAAISTALGSAYINDFPNAGRLQRVVVQADAPARMLPEDVLRLSVLNARGQSVPFSAFASTRWIKGAMQTVRYNGYPAMRIGGSAAPGFSTGQAMAEMERLAAQLPAGFGYEWTGLSREEKLAGSQSLILYSFAILSVFLCLAALYESWSIPLAVILVVPLGVLGVLLGTWLRGYSNDVYFQVGLITIIGLSAKNAILIIEFAKDLQAQGKSVIESALAAAHLRFRPIIMTSMAFTLGVLPLALATGAGSASQRVIGTGVIGGILTGTSLAVLFVPVFFVVIRSLFKDSPRQHALHAEQATHMGIHGDQ